MNTFKSVTVFAPATVANVGSAFDVLGFALESPGDTVTASWSTLCGVQISEIKGSSIQLPTDPDKNTASVSVQTLLRNVSKEDWKTLRLDERGISLSIQKGLPIGSGLGSSSASTVAAVVAANTLLGELFNKSDLLPFAMEGERIACGAAHADNVAPSLLGGFILIRSYSPLDIIPLPCPSSLYVALITPDIEVRTSDARRILKQAVPLEDAIKQWGNVAALIAGIFKNDINLIGRSLEDRIIEPNRADLIPGFYDLRKTAHDEGALGFAISGSGPTTFAVCASEETAQKVAKALTSTCNKLGLEGRSFYSRINPLGAVVTETMV
jgi:homoserine kinase